MNSRQKLVISGEDRGFQEIYGEERKKLLRTMDLHSVWYLDFLDYVKIVTRNDNWIEAFQRVFGDKDDFEVAMV